MVLTNNTSEFSALGLGLEVLEKTEAYVVWVDLLLTDTTFDDADIMDTLITLAIV